MAIAEHLLPEWTLGDYMTKARKVAHLDQKDVAEALGVSRSLVGRWENDLSIPNARKLQAFAKLTGFPVDWFFSTIGYKSQDAGGTPDLTLLAGQSKGRGRGLPLFASPV